MKSNEVKMSPQSKTSGLIFLEALISPGIEKKYSLVAKWIDSKHPKLLIKAKISTLTQIISDRHSEWSYDPISSSDKYIVRTRKILKIFQYRMHILDDLRLNANKEKEQFFLLNLWPYDDLGYFRDEYQNRCNKVGRNSTDENFFPVNLVFQKILNAIPFPIFIKNDQMVYKAFNNKFKQFLGRSKQHILNKNVHDVALSKEASEYQRKDTELLEAFPDTRDQFYISTVRDRNSEEVPVIFCKSTFTGNIDNQAAGIVGIIIKLTDNNILFIKQAIKEIENKKKEIDNSVLKI